MKIKKAILTLSLSLLLIFACTLPALAGYEYGLVYDDTAAMQENILREYGKTVLPQLSDVYEVECRVDIVTETEGYSLDEYAEGFYDYFDYGDDYTNGGLLFMLFLAPDDAGYSLNGYTLYYGGSAYSDLQAYVEDAMNGRITEYAWSGDLDLDRAAVNDALQVYADAIAGYFGDTVDAVLAGASAAAADVSAIAQSDAADGTDEPPALDFVTDAAGLLSAEEYSDLNEKARQISEEYQCGVYIVTVEDYQDYYAGSVIGCANSIFTEYDLGYGDTKDGVLLLLSMADRDYALIAHGDLGNAAFTDYGKERMSDGFLSYFGRDNWNGGFKDYLDTADQYLEMAVNGEPFDTNSDDSASKAARSGIVLLVPTLTAGGVSLAQSKKMKSVRRSTNASSYAAPAGLILHDKKDVYTHSTESRTRIASSSGSSRGGGGGGTTVGSGGFSGRSGKF